MLAVRGARLFDGTTLTRDTTVLVADRRITALHSGALPDGTDLVDLGDVTLLPGLVDAHLHLAFDASTDPVGHLAGASDDQVLDTMRAAARGALAAGVTTVRDLGDRGYLALRLRDELDADPARGPQVLPAGPPITTTRGHCWYLGGEVTGTPEIRRAVRDRADRGAAVVKVMASGGELTPGTFSHRPQFDRAELRAAVDEAHRLGLPIAAHGHAAEAIANVVAAGFDSIEHASFLSEDGIDDRPDVLAALARSGVPVSTTLAMLPDVPMTPRLAARWPALTALLRSARQAGATLLLSSDAGIGPAKPHGVLAYAVGMAVATLGWPPTDALRAVTSLPAEVCGVGDREGRLRTGYDADILAVAGDPLTDPAALRDVRAVFRQGRRVR